MGKPESTHLAEELGIARAGPKHSGTAEHLYTWCGRMPWGGSPEEAMTLEDSLEFSVTCSRGTAWERGGCSQLLLEL